MPEVPACYPAGLARPYLLRGRLVRLGHDVQRRTIYIEGEVFRRKGERRLAVVLDGEHKYDYPGAGLLRKSGLQMYSGPRGHVQPNGAETRQGTASHGASGDSRLARRAASGGSRSGSRLVSDYYDNGVPAHVCGCFEDAGAETSHE